MLYFSKLKIILIYFFILTISLITVGNFLDKDFNFIDKKINLGLDLQGGSYLLLEVDSKPLIEQKLQNKLLSIKKYFKNNNLQYSNIVLKDEKIYLTTEDKYQKEFLDYFLDKKNNLNIYFERYKSYEIDHEIKNNNLILSYSKYGIINIETQTLDQSLEIVRRRIDEIGTKEPTILKRGKNRILVELPGLKNPERIKSLLGKTANLTFRFVGTDASNEFGYEELASESGDEQLKISRRVIISGENLVDAQPMMDNLNNEAVVSFKLDRLGSQRFGQATKKNVGKRLAIVLDGKVISAPFVRESILGGSGQISGDFTFQTATDLALLLRSGALPAPINIAEERTVGPDLGEDSIKAGAISLILGFFLVIAFMLSKYKILGLISNLSLFVNLVLLLGILTLFEATLTLPGIAGIILTVGMAVDANVLIFERIKEEIGNEENQIYAYDAGYRKAQSAVLDANITTLISAIILFMMGSGPVKGFAITLGVGILTTLFCTYFFARHLTSMYVMKFKKSRY